MAQEDITRSVKDTGGKFNFADAIPYFSTFGKLASSVVGGILGKRNTQEQVDMLDKEIGENNNERRRVGYRHPSQSMIAQYALRRTFDSIRDRNRQASGTAAVMGDSTGGAIEKGDNLAALSDVAARVTASEAARQDQLNQQFEQRDRELKRQKINLKQGQGQYIANAVQNAFKTTGDMSQA